MSEPCQTCPRVEYLCECRESAEQARQRIDEEVYRIQRQIHDCAHCAALRGQMVRLLNVRTRDPLVMKREELAAFLREREADR